MKTGKSVGYDIGKRHTMSTCNVLLLLVTEVLIQFVFELVYRLRFDAGSLFQWAATRLFKKLYRCSCRQFGTSSRLIFWYSVSQLKNTTLISCESLKHWRKRKSHSTDRSVSSSKKIWHTQNSSSISKVWLELAVQLYTMPNTRTEAKVSFLEMEGFSNHFIQGMQLIAQLLNLKP